MSFHKEPIPKNEQLKSIIRKRVNTENTGTYMVESGINTQIVYHNIKSHAKGILNRSQRSQSGSFRNKITAIKTQSNEKKLQSKKKQLTFQSKNSASKIVSIDKKIVTEGHVTDQEMYQKQRSVQHFKNNEKDAILQKLRQRNKILKDQIYKIQKLEDERTNKSLQKKQYNFQEIYYATSTKQSLLQQLHNAYFKIKQMEAQIQQLRKIQALDEPKKVANLKARLVEVEKVKNQSILKLEKMKRQNKKKEEKIEECRQGGGYAQTVRQLIIELDEMRQKHRELSVFEEKRKQKIVKQQEYIRKLQKQLAENGASSQFIQQMMNKCIYGIEKDKSKIPEKIDILPVLTKPSGEKMRKQYQKAQHEIGILTKSIKQQQKMLEQVIVQQKNANLICQRARFQSQQLDQEIEQLSNKISQTRKSIDPSNLKPKPLPPKQPSLQDQKQQQKQHIKEMRKKFYQKKTKKYLQGLQNMDQQLNQFDEKIQSKLQIIDIPEEEVKDKDKDDVNYSGGNEEDQQGNNENHGNDGNVSVEWEGKDVEVFGVHDPTGKIFSDKEVCHNMVEDQCKITGFSVLLLGSNSIIGIKAQYNYKIDTNFHKFGSNSKSAIAEGATIQDDFACVDEEYVTSISGTFSSRNTLINITVLTNLNRYHRFGSVLTSRGKGSVQFDICSDGNSRPVYIIGCVNQFGICRFGAKVVRDQSEQPSENEI